VEEPDPLRSVLKILKDCKHITFLTGAGISKESGIPTFRDKDGYWSKYDPMKLASPQGFLENPALVWEWYRHRLKIISSARPNQAHEAIKEMEKYFNVTVITQNIDNLHIEAGSTCVLELHGNIFRSRCTQCDSKFDTSLLKEKIPRCPKCGGIIRPDVVWFGEMLNEDLLKRCYEVLTITDAIFVIGTSNQVYPAAGFPLLVKQHGGKIIEINLNNTPLSPIADVFLQGKATLWMKAILEKLKEWKNSMSLS